MDALSERGDTTSLSTFTNKGSLRLSTGTIDRDSVINDGFWQASNLNIDGQTFTNKSFGNLKILDQLTLTSNLMNEGDITVKNLLKLEKGINKGTIKGDYAVIDVDQDMTNAGEVRIKELSGRGTFTNKSKVQFTGTPEAPSKISVKDFENCASSNTKASIKGTDIAVTPTNETFVTHDNSEIVAKNLIFERPTTPSSTPFEIKGSIHTDVLNIHRQETVNLGAVSATDFFVRGNKFLNATKSNLDVKKSVKAG